MIGVGVLRRGLSRLSPASRRWQQILASCRLDPGAFEPGDLEELSARDFLICGVPRSGTALLTAQLFQPPQVVTVMEPWDGMRMPVASLFRSLRAEAGAGALSRGRLDVPALRHEREVRWVGDEALTSPVTVDDSFHLGVKWPAYWRYLGLLEHTKFLVCVRDPVEVVASFRQTGGRLAQGLDYDIAFNRTMNEQLLAATDDASLRRVLLYDYITERILPHRDRPNVMLVRYERWFQEPDALLAELAEFLGTESLAPGPAQIRSPASRDHPTDDASLVATHCRTASALGYSVR